MQILGVSGARILITGVAATAADFTPYIDWGDGGYDDAAPYVVADPNGGWAVIGSHTFAQAGTYNTHINVYDDMTGQTIAMYGGVKVNAPLVTIAGDDSVNAGSSYLLSLAAPTGAGVQSATVDWGDGAGPKAIDLTDGLPPLLSHVYNDGGDDDTIIVTATDDNGVATTVTQPVSVLDVAPTVPPIAPVTADEDRTVSGIATTFTDPSSTETQTAWIDWGDGSTASATVDESAGTITLPSHTYAYNGNYFPVVTVTNSGGASTDAPFTVTVGSPRIVLSSADPIAATQGTVYTAPRATFTDAANTIDSTSVYSATVTWNGTQTDTATVMWNATNEDFELTDTTAPTMSGDVSVRIVVLNTTSGEYAARNLVAAATDPAPTITSTSTLTASARAPFSEAEKGIRTYLTADSIPGSFIGVPRTARIAPGGMVFHCLNRGNDRRAIFDDEGDYAAFERVLEETQGRTQRVRP